MELYRAAFEALKAAGAVYPCTCSRKDIQQSLQAPHTDDDEPIYPGTCRERSVLRFTDCSNPHSALRTPQSNWRFRVPDGEVVSFEDGGFGRQRFTAGKDFGDFVVWRQDGFPAYQLAVVVDDAAMQITEVVRGADLLKSTARQLLLYQALGWPAPAFYHCPLMTDEAGQRLAKRHDSLSLRALRGQGATPESLRENWPEF
jgi:glutamyl-tRNA synthetase